MKHFLTIVLVLCCSALSVKAGQVGVYCYLAAVGTEVYQDENIKACLVMAADGTLILEVENLTDDILYIDRGRSFSWVNGQSEPLFIPQANTQSHTHSDGVIDNTGSAHTMTRVSTESFTQRHTLYDQRVLPVAPQGKAQIYAWHQLWKQLNHEVINPGKVGGLFNGKCKGNFCDTQQKFRMGDSRQYTELGTPLQVKAYVEYRFQEHGDGGWHFSLSDYVASVQIGSRDGVDRNGLLRQPALHVKPCFAFRSGKHIGTMIGEAGVVAAAVGVLILAGDAAEPDDF